LLGIAGNLLAAAAALSLVLRRGVRDLGGLVDAGLIGFAVGGVLWAVLPQVQGGWAEQLHLFVVVFVLPATLGPLMRLLRGTGRQPITLWMLFGALGLALVGHIVEAIGDGNRVANDIGQMLFMVALTAIGLFALDPAGVKAAQAPAALKPERLSTARLSVLGLVVVAVSAIGAANDVAGRSAASALLVVQGALMVGLVMFRVGLLAGAHERAQQALEYRARHDPLTQLPNRHEFISRLRAAAAAGEQCALLFCDLDDFKSINDNYGHDVGDRVLAEVARRLRECVRPADVVSRIGGDEFVVLLRGASDARAVKVRDRIETELGQLPDLPGGVGVRVSVGAAVTHGATDPDELLRAADHAMYREKARRRR
jgi:diguanylate cyclase (GGDEF)-like protein